jgi:hypothetical protein
MRQYLTARSRRRELGRYVRQKRNAGVNRCFLNNIALHDMPWKVVRLFAYPSSLRGGLIGSAPAGLQDSYRSGGLALVLV